MNIYDFVDLLPLDDHGWFANADQLEVLIKEHNVKTILEIGAWLGKSTRWFAKQIPGDGVVFAIDTWRGSGAEHINVPEYADKLPDLYQQFLSNVIHEGLTNKIIPIRMESLEAAQAIKFQPDLIYIDAAHDTESVLKDLNAWVPKMRQDTIITGDDRSWPTVMAAVEPFAAEHGFTVHGTGNFWYYKR